MSQINLNNYEAFLLDYFESRLNASEIKQLQAFVKLHPELDIDLSNINLPSLNTPLEEFPTKSSLSKDEHDYRENLIINYLENNLNPSQKLKFENSLNTDPSLQTLLNQYRQTYLKTDSNLNFNKNSLRKTEDDLLLKNSHIQSLEALLTDSEKTAYKQQIEDNTTFKKDHLLFQQTKLKADLNIVFPNKEILKKENKIIALFSFKQIQGIAAAILLLLAFVVIYQFNKKEETKQMQLANHALQSTTKANQLKHLKPILFNHQKGDIKNDAVKSISKHQEVLNQAFVQQSNNILNNKVKNTELSKIDSVQKDLAIITHSAAPQIKNDTVLFAADLASLNNQISNLESLEVEQESDDAPIKKRQNNFWEKLIVFGNKAKKLGVKGIEANVQKNERYFIAFNNLSLEKK